MPDIQINLTPEEINKTIAEAVVNSTLGNILIVRIKEITNDYALKNHVNAVIEQVVRQKVAEMIVNDHADRIKELAKEALSDELVSKSLVTRALERLRY